MTQRSRSQSSVLCLCHQNGIILYSTQLNSTSKINTNKDTYCTDQTVICIWEGNRWLGGKLWQPYAEFTTTVSCRLTVPADSELSYPEVVPSLFSQPIRHAGTCLGTFSPCQTRSLTCLGTFLERNRLSFNISQQEALCHTQKAV